MATKEVAVGGAVLAGGGVGGGYTAYRYLGDSSEEEEGKPAAQQESESGGQKIEDFLDNGKSNGNDGRPITKVDSSIEEGWWKKAYNKYFLEIDETQDEITGVGGKDKRNSETADKLNEFKNGCKELLSKKKTNPSDTNDDVKKAKKWCVTYQTVKDKITDGKKTLEEKTNANWKTKYDNSKSDSDFKFKNLVEKLKGTEDNDTKKKEAIHKWCTMAMDAESDDIKTQVEKYCERK